MVVGDGVCLLAPLPTAIRGNSGVRHPTACGSTATARKSGTGAGKLTPLVWNDLSSPRVRCALRRHRRRLLEGGMVGATDERAADATMDHPGMRGSEEAGASHRRPMIRRERPRSTIAGSDRNPTARGVSRVLRHRAQLLRRPHHTPRAAAYAASASGATVPGVAAAWAIAQTKPSNSRATATIATCLGLPRLSSRK
jgi:hypothetical protein